MSTTASATKTKLSAKNTNFMVFVFSLLTKVKTAGLIDQDVLLAILRDHLAFFSSVQDQTDLFDTLVNKDTVKIVQQNIKTFVTASTAAGVGSDDIISRIVANASIPHVDDRALLDDAANKKKKATTKTSVRKPRAPKSNTVVSDESDGEISSPPAEKPKRKPRTKKTSVDSDIDVPVKPVRKSMAKKATTEPVDEPLEEPLEEPVEEQAEEPVEEQAEEPVEEQAEEPVDEVVEEVVEAPIKPARKPRAKKTVEVDTVESVKPKRKPRTKKASSNTDSEHDSASESDV